MKRVAGPDVADGVASLVGGAGDGVGGAGTPLVVREGGVRLQGVTAANKSRSALKLIICKKLLFIIS